MIQIDSDDSYFSSKDFYFSKIENRTHHFYITILFFLVFLFSLLPLIKVNVTIQARGIVRPLIEKTQLYATQTHIVSKIFIHEGQFVHAGDTLVKYMSDLLDNNRGILFNELEKINYQINDLYYLNISSEYVPVSKLIYNQYRVYQQKREELSNRLLKSERELNRNKILLNGNLISKQEFEDLTFAVNQNIIEANILESDQVSQWQADYEVYINKRNDLLRQIKDIDNQNKFMTLISPISGTIQQFSGIYPGSLLQSGQLVAVISPDARKLVEVLISPKQIGYLFLGQKVKIQVDAFNYNQWGILDGTISEISNDFISVNNSPGFIVKCSLDKDWLQLKNGMRSSIMKGMTINARFEVCKRSLFDLLYQKIDDYFNPSRNSITK